jgi:Xaa-Pro aminopeptidase
MSIVDNRLRQLRAVMKAEGIDACLIPSQDPHQSEYVAAYWKGRSWISGFTGSAGTAVITNEHAGLWTDSRYFIQGEKELADSEFVLEKQLIPHTPQHLEWLRAKLPSGAVIGIDGRVFSVAQVNHIRRVLNDDTIEIRYQDDLLQQIWEDRPALPQTSVFELDVRYAGLSRAEKLSNISSQLGPADYYLVTGLDDIAWALNIRGMDVECNPVSISYLLIGKEQHFWFIDEAKVPAALQAKMEKEGIAIHPYEAIQPFLRQLSVGSRVLYTPATLSILLYEAMEAAQWVKGPNLIRPMKAIKNDTEISHIKQVMRKDGVALVRFFRWLEKELEAGNETLTEYQVGRQLDEFRKAQDNYYGESFSAIVGYKGNGAIVHYRAEDGKSASLKAEGILLVDSGGQYLEGTTDITRTIALSHPTKEQQLHYTLVLKGHIALSTAIFPKGTTGVQLDTLARMHLWKHGLNYGHGTGHGVGFFLNVHEPPQGFAPSPKAGRGLTPFEPGMLTSNEPGYYKTDAHGIRIENLELCVKVIDHDTDTYYGFEPVTLFPISTNLIDQSLLTGQEKSWLNDYHQKVYSELAPLLDAEEKAWLAHQCKEL